MKKNRLLVFIIFCSFFIYSCASTSSESDLQDDSQLETPAVAESEVVPEINKEEEIVDANKDSDSSEISEEQNDEIETETSEETNQNKNELEIPEEIEEPLIRDLPIPDEIVEETEIPTEESEEQDSLEEPLTELDNLEPIESIEQAENQSEADEEDLDEEDNDDDLNAHYPFEELFYETVENEVFEGDEETETEENLNSEEAEEAIEDEIVIIPSRSVTLKRGENLVVIYPGSGWIYMGSLDEYNNLASRGRKLGATDTKYTLLAKEPGTQIHHFYKVDNLTGLYIDDYIEVTVLDKKGSSKTTITAPAYSEIIPEKPESPAKASEPIVEESEKNEEKIIETSVDTTIKTSDKTSTNKTTKTSVEKTVENSGKKSQQKPEEKKNESQNTKNTENIATTAVKPEEKNETSEIQSIEFNPEEVVSEEPEVMDDEDLIVVEEDTYVAVQNINTDELLDQAQILFNEMQFVEANKLLIDFFEYSFTRIDEALYLQGQILEADSDIKDVKSAIQSYEALVKNYPASTYWNDANKRIKYLRKFYYISN